MTTTAARFPTPASPALLIERDDAVQFHVQGTLSAVTRWVASDDEGIAEWLKNSRRMYQVDRANVAEEHRIAAILFADARGSSPARIGLLDVGGVSSGDLDRWSVWQDPTASRAGSNAEEEQTQGNGGKAYMYRLFTGPTSIMGVAGGKLNRKGFEGPAGSEERGKPGWIPNRAEGLDAPTGNWKVELNYALEPYGIEFKDLPPELRRALTARESFTLVEGASPTSAYQGKIAADSIIERVVRHEQSTLVLEQMRVYAFHNAEIMLGGEPLKLDDIEPFEGFERPLIIAIPDTLLYDGRALSTTADGTTSPGRITLRTSKKNMLTSYKRLKPRWKISYRTRSQMIGAKPVSELVPVAPGSYHVYGTVELAALEPDYVSHGRVRPNDGPLMTALDDFVAEEIRKISRQIAERNRQDFDERELDEVARENRMLDKFKDQFLPEGAEGGDEGEDGRGGGGGGGGGQREAGLTPYVIELRKSVTEIVVGRGVSVSLAQLLSPVVRDEVGRTVSGVRVAYQSDEPGILEVDSVSGAACAKQAGDCAVYVQLTSTGLSSEIVPCKVVVVDHVLLTPRQFELPIRSRRQIVAEVTTEDGERRTDVLLNWRHDAEDQLVVRIRPTGFVTGNRLGETQVYAGAGSVEEGVWARVPAAITVTQARDQEGKGEGHPQLKITGRDLDPETGEVRPGDPEQPTLWQDPVDVANNIWWLNLEAPEASLAFRNRETLPQVWRLLHASKLVEMVCQVHMKSDYFAENEHPEAWATHKQALERHQIEVGSGMWEKLGGYVFGGEEL